MHLHVQFVGDEPTSPAPSGNYSQIVEQECACGCEVTADEKWIVAEIERIDPLAHEFVADGAVERAMARLVIELRDELQQLRDLVNVSPAVDPWISANIKSTMGLAAELVRPLTDAERMLVDELVDGRTAVGFPEVQSYCDI